jgi:hypothetical protein
LPEKAIYRRPDHRNLDDSTEELLVVEIELNRLGKISQSINFELPPNLTPQHYTSFIELSRSGGELRAAVRLRSRKSSAAADQQIAFDFGEM